MSLDFRDFLGAKAEPAVLPYFGGTRVDARDRRLRLAPGAAIEPGWHRFRVDGRRATPLEPAEPADLAGLPALRGHWLDGWVFTSGREVARVALPPAEEPAPLARVTARRWPSGELLLDTIDFEDDAEVGARLALDALAPLGDLRGVAPSLRAAFGYGLVAAVGRAREIPVAPREVLARTLEVAARGREAAIALLDELSARRRLAAPLAPPRARVRARAGDPVERADAALEAAGARMTRTRRVGDELEIHFTMEDQGFICVADPDTLQILDAGICLSGADREITVDSLPSVIREAIYLDALNITRHR